MNSLWAVVPVKGFERAKSRLRTVLGSEPCQQLARALFEHTLETLQRVDSLEGVLVATDCPDVARRARAFGARAQRDPADPVHLNRIVDLALQALTHCGASHALVVMADLPRLQVADLQQVIEHLRRNELVICPDARGQGTNVLGLALSTTRETCFGHPDSFQRHRALACGQPHAVVDNPRLAFDVDLPADYAQLARPAHNGAAVPALKPRSSRP